MLIDCETRRHCTSANEKQMACLTQTLVGNQVVISTTNPERLGDLSKTLKLDLDITKPVGPLFKGLKHEGHQYPDEICNWFSAAINRNVVAVHSAADRQMDLDPKRHILMKEGDTRKTFTTDAALHIVNEASVDELRQRVNDQYPAEEESVYVDAEQFRSNIVVNTKVPFSEDFFAEMRIGTCLLRNVGPTIRCNAIRTDWEKQLHCKENEPSATLSKFRNIPGLGNIFGMYYQQEFMNEEIYNKVCKEGYPTFQQAIKAHPTEFRAFDTTKYTRVREGEMIQVRLIQERSWRS